MSKIIFFMAFAGLLIFSGCYKDRTVTNVDTGQVVTKEVSFANDVIPIFNTSCSLSGCHSSGGKSPDLTSSKAYTSLVNGNHLNIAEPTASNIYLWMTGKKSTPMPVGGVNNSYASTMLAWIQQGAKNN
jgi:hypothetical protein